jgi:hypothetical protein
MICRKCGIDKPIEDFPANGEKGTAIYHKRGTCKDCTNAYMRARNHHPDHHAKYLESARNSRIKTSYGLSPDDFDALLLLQNGGCAICGAKYGRKIKDRLAVDHDHITGKVRGLLCAKCNRTLGMLTETPQTLRRMAEYIENSQEEDAMAKESMWADSSRVGSLIN